MTFLDTVIILLESDHGRSFQELNIIMRVKCKSTDLNIAAHTEPTSRQFSFQLKFESGMSFLILPNHADSRKKTSRCFFMVNKLLYLLSPFYVIGF